MISARINYLATRYFDNTCTPAEKLELAEWISRQTDDAVLQQVLGDAWESHVPLIQMPDEMSDRIVAGMFGRTTGTVAVTGTSGAEVVPMRNRRKIWWAAAGLFLMGGIGMWAWQHQPAPAPVAESRQQRYKNEVMPGSNRAILTLADGSTIALDSAGNGLLGRQGAVKIIKQANGELAYIGNGNSEAMYNTMSTPRGGQYHLTLPDGTQVWLNAASSITYPAAFTGKERKVTVKGEAYFEVTPNAHMPFRVAAGNTEITVLGTRFNVNAYTEEPAIRTTLVDGTVSVAVGKISMMLRPRMQARVGKDNVLHVTENIDTDETIAWKNGFFQFTDADMPTVMRQIEKWYDVNVSYEGAIPEKSFGGGIQRSLPLTKVLGILEENGVKFKIEGKKIIVLK
ncbi:FecR family protein [Chitinophaga polysaccharea]|uniref:FecR family protein n=1 Tax=Chitinophaga polysaccharea TaxID=1293035 RepID=UPI001157D1BA|nr:FecR family protein [Chitinophaga polysaccharea]